MSDVVVSLEGALISQNYNGDITSEQNEELEEASDDESENDHMFNTSPLPPVQDIENMLSNKKRSKGKLSKAFQWSLGLLTKRKKDHDSSSRESRPFSDSTMIPAVESLGLLTKRKKDHDSSSRQSWPFPDSWPFSDSTIDRLHYNANPLFRSFSIAEIRAATNDFNRNLKIGEGGYGRTYRGWIDHGTLEVVVKFTKSLAAVELIMYRVEIKAQSQLQLRHLNIISLIGYCADKGKLMLVYNYMVNRSLGDQLYGQGSGHSPLPWTKRLEICVGAAKGLQYLHYGTTKRVILGDFTPSNILLDENWAAKISDFELSKLVTPDCTHVTSVLHGTNGYMAPEYCRDGQVTEKIDVYAFGVVLLEVVCARKPYVYSLDEDQESLVHWFRTCLRQKSIDQIIDPYLIGRISPECLMQYLKVAWNCLHDRGTARPTMNSVVEDLQIVLQLQQTWYIDAEIDNSSETWIPSGVGRAYNNVLAYQYGDYFEDLDTYMQASDDPVNGDPFFTTDSASDQSIGLTVPLR